MSEKEEKEMKIEERRTEEEMRRKREATKKKESLKSLKCFLVSGSQCPIKFFQSHLL